MIKDIIGIIAVCSLFYFMIKVGYDGLTFNEKLIDFYGDVKSVFNWKV